MNHPGGITTTLRARVYPCLFACNVTCRLLYVVWTVRNAGVRNAGVRNAGITPGPIDF